MPTPPSASDTARIQALAARLSGEYGAALAFVLDLIVPPKPSRRLPGASQVGVLDHVVRQAPEALAEIVAGFESLDAASIERHDKAFVSLDDTRRRALVDSLRAAQPLFMQRLALETVTAYYMDPAVLAALEIEDRPPFPKGFQVVAGDLTLLAPVRKRGKIYRDA